MNIGENALGERTRDEIHQALDELAQSIVERCGGNLDEFALVGVLRGGVPVARFLARAIARHRNTEVPEVGELDISLYRDDAGSPGKIPRIQGTQIPFDIEGAHVVLVDDILHTGRTVRAAIDLLMDFGRPARIELAVLADRGGRQLPIQPDYCAFPPREDEGRQLELLCDQEGIPDALRVIV